MRHLLAFILFFLTACGCENIVPVEDQLVNHWCSLHKNDVSMELWKDGRGIYNWSAHEEHKLTWYTRSDSLFIEVYGLPTGTHKIISSFEIFKGVSDEPVLRTVQQTYVYNYVLCKNL